MIPTLLEKRDVRKTKLSQLGWIPRVRKHQENTSRGYTIEQQRYIYSSVGKLLNEIPSCCTKEKILTQSFIRVIFLWVTFFVAFGGHCRGIEKRVKIRKKRKDRRSRKCTTYCTVGKCGHFSYSMKNRTHIFSGSKCIKNVKF